MRAVLGVSVLAIGIQGAVAVAEPIADEAGVDLGERTPEQIVGGLAKVAETYPGGLDALLSLFTTGPCAWVMDLAQAPPACNAVITGIDDAAGDISLVSPSTSLTYDCIEAFLSADPVLAPIADIMSISDLGLGLSPENWRTTWYKGGSEGGVFAVAFLAQAADGRVFTVTALLANPAQVLDESFVVRELRALARSAFALAAGTGV